MGHATSSLHADRFEVACIFQAVGLVETSRTSSSQESPFKLADVKNLLIPGTHVNDKIAFTISLVAGHVGIFLVLDAISPQLQPGPPMLTQQQLFPPFSCSSACSFLIFR